MDVVYMNDGFLVVTPGAGWKGFKKGCGYRICIYKAGETPWRRRTVSRDIVQILYILLMNLYCTIIAYLAPELSISQR